MSPNSKRPDDAADDAPDEDDPEDGMRGDRAPDMEIDDHATLQRRLGESSQAAGIPADLSNPRAPAGNVADKTGRRDRARDTNAPAADVERDGPTNDQAG